VSEPPVQAVKARGWRQELLADVGLRDWRVGEWLLLPER